MSDSPVNPYEKPKKLQIKLPPIHVEAIHARSSVRYGAANLLSDIAEKSFPQVTYNDEVIEKLRAIGQKTNETKPDSSSASPATHAAEQTDGNNRLETSVEKTALAPVIQLDSYRQEKPAEQNSGHEIDETTEPTLLDANLIRQAVKNAYEGKKAA